MNDRSTIQAFYTALFARDTDTVTQLADELFADGVVLHRPESLPGGGRVEGAEGVKRFMLGVTKMPAGGPLDPAEMEVGEIVEAGSDVFVELRFPFAGVPTSALEWWSLDGGRATSIRAFYWDTAAMLKAASS